MFYIYALVDPVNDTPFYIGKGKGDRAYHHLKGVDTINNRKCDYINNLRSLGIEPEVHMIVENIEDESLAYRLEYYMIKNAKLFSVNLTNRVGIDLRPPCRKGAKLSIETRLKISEGSKGKKKGPLSSERKRIISETLRGREPDRALKIDESILREMYVSQNMKRSEIAKLFNVSLYPINRLLKKYNIMKNSDLLNKER